MLAFTPNLEWTTRDGEGEDAPVLVFAAGERHEIDSPSEALVRHAGSAHAAGALVVHEGLDTSHVQSQEDGEAAYAAAQEDGSWHEGNLAQYALDEMARQEAKEEIAASVAAEGGEE